MLHTHTTLARTLAGAISCLLFVGTTTAQVSASLSTVDNTSQLTGYITQDLSVNTVDDWVGTGLCGPAMTGSLDYDARSNHF
jgi:hypothetical protein